MKPIELQLITVKLQNGEHGIFVGTPLIQDPSIMQDNQVSEIWFSDVRGLPENTPLDQVIELVKAQFCKNRNSMH